MQPPHDHQEQHCQALKQEIVKFEQLILVAIDFHIPATTAYEQLDATVEGEELSDCELRRRLTRTLKILMTALAITWDLSFDPSLGYKIHEVTKKNPQLDPLAWNIYRRCLKQLQRETHQPVGVEVS